MLTRSLLFVALLALSMTGAAQTADKLVERYSELAGSEQNANALVTGLRDGTQVTLSSGTGSTSFTPPTRKMGYGNVDAALALAEASLKNAGISNPTPQQLQAALMGGTVGTTKFEGILQMRRDGVGWGQIAQSLGFKLGVVKRADAAQPRAEHGRPEQAERPARPDKPERPVKPERPERAGKS